MTFLSEDPTYLAGALGVLAGAFLIALRVTQQGKYLIWALGSLGLAMTVLLVERFWVTDNERIERVVYDLRRAVMASDAEAVLKHLTPDVQYVQHGTAIPGEATRELIRNQPVQRDVRLRLYPRTSDQRGTPDASRQGRVSNLRQGTLAYGTGKITTWEPPTPPGRWGFRRPLRESGRSTGSRPFRYPRAFETSQRRPDHVSRAGVMAVSQIRPADSWRRGTV